MIDVTDATFNDEVIAASRTQPVVVDLWAPWCGPCKSLAPILEKVIAETDGAVLGAKVNIDENPEVARAMQAQSIPLVVAFVDGQPADGFLGAQPEPMVRDFVAKLLPEGVLSTGAAPANDDGAATDAVGGAVGDADGDEPASPAATLSEPEPESEPPPPPKPEFNLAEVETELETLLATVKTSETDRARFVELLDLLGPEHPATTPWRKRLATTLY